MRIIGGYSKLGIDNQPEIHLSKKAKIILAPRENEINRKIPLLLLEYVKKSLKISEINEKEGYIPLISGIVQVREFSEKQLKNGDKSFLLRFYFLYTYPFFHSLGIVLELWIYLYDPLDTQNIQDN